MSANAKVQPDPDLKQYKYLPLDRKERQIRLLQLSTHKEVQIRSFDFDRRPAYQALSYFWGESNTNTSLTVKGSRLSIKSDNLARFLSNYMDVSNDDYGRMFPGIAPSAQSPRHAYLWIDQICINQDDVVERDSQVAMMRDIYSSAVEVICWPSNSGDEMKIIEKALRRCRSKPRMDFIGRLVDRPPDDVDLTLIGAKYWNRIWIQQEIFFASNIRIFSGGESVDWDEIFPDWYF